MDSKFNIGHPRNAVIAVAMMGLLLLVWKLWPQGHTSPVANTEAPASGVNPESSALPPLASVTDPAAQPKPLKPKWLDESGRIGPLYHKLKELETEDWLDQLLIGPIYALGYDAEWSGVADGIAERFFFHLRDNRVSLPERKRRALELVNKTMSLVDRMEMDKLPDREIVARHITNADIERWNFFRSLELHLGTYLHKIRWTVYSASKLDGEIGGKLMGRYLAHAKLAVQIFGPEIITFRGEEEPFGDFSDPWNIKGVDGALQNALAK